jgi:hypothetical protein
MLLDAQRSLLVVIDLQEKMQANTALFKAVGKEFLK